MIARISDQAGGSVLSQLRSGVVQECAPLPFIIEGGDDLVPSLPALTIVGVSAHHVPKEVVVVRINPGPELSIGVMHVRHIYLESYGLGERASSARVNYTALGRVSSAATSRCAPRGDLLPAAHPAVRARGARRRRPPQPPPEGQLGETHQAPSRDQDEGPGHARQLSEQHDKSASRVHRPGVIHPVDFDAEALAHPRGNPEGCLECGSWYHHCVSRGGGRILHSPEKLTVQGVHVQPDGGGPALGLGIELVRPAFGIDVDKSSPAYHGPAVPLEPVGISRYDSFLVAVHVENGSANYPAPRWTYSAARSFGAGGRRVRRPTAGPVLAALLAGARGGDGGHRRLRAA